MSCKQEINFQTIFPNGSFFKPALDELIISGKIDNFRVKSAIWKFYLNIFPQTKQTCVTLQEWIKIIKANRILYEDIKNKFIIRTTDFESKASFDPLGHHENSKWTQYFIDDATMKEITKDTNRLFQEYEFFQNPENRERINQIIFLHLRYNNMEYKQGYHELCGVVFYLFANEMKSKPPKREKLGDPSYAYNFLFSKNSVDADVFWTYSAILTFMLPFYQIHEDKSMPFCVQIANHIIESLLKSEDPELCSIISVPDVAVPLIPWLRLLFARLFQLEDISKVWTIIIRFYPDMNIILAIALNLILSYKQQFLECDDQTSVLLVFMRVHVNSNCEEILRKSVQYYLKNLKGRQFDNRQIKNKFGPLLEPICKEIQEDMCKITTLPKDELLMKLAKLRDSLNMVVTSEENEDILKGGSATEMLQSLPSFASSLPEDSKISSFDIDMINDSIMVLPKATTEDIDDNSVDLMQEENVHHKKPKRLESITKMESIFE